MKTLAISALISSLLLASCASTSQDADAGAATAASSAVATTGTAPEETSTASNADDMICRKEIVTGSNRRREVCLTRAQRREIQQNSRDEFNRNRSLRE